MLIQLINERFSDVMRRLDVMDAKNDQRDMRVNTMDAANKAEIAKVREEVNEAKTAARTVGWVIGVLSSCVGFIAGIAPTVWSVFHQS